MPAPFPLPPVRQQGRDYGITPAFQSGPMQQRGPVESFDLTGGAQPWLQSRLSKSMVTGDRSLTGPSAGSAPQFDAAGGRIGSRGMTDQRRAEMAGRRLDQAARGGNVQAQAMLYRGPNGFGRGFGGMPQGGYVPPIQRPQPMGQPLQPQPPTVNNGQPLQPAAPLSPPVSAEQALGMPVQPQPITANDRQPQPTFQPPTNMPWQNQPLAGFDASMGPLPPSTLDGGAGLPPPSPFNVQSVGGWDAFTQTMPDGSQKYLNARPTPEAQPPPLSAAEVGRIRAAGFAPAEVGGRGFDAQGIPYLQPLPAPPVPTERVTEGADGGVSRTYTQPRSATPAAPPPAAPANNAPAVKTATGNQFRPADSASTQTGQMPNANYAAPLPPEQMLAAARDEYARTGKDEALKQYFAQYPSEAVQFILGALNPQPTGGPRVMTQAEALRSLQPMPQLPPITNRPAAPSFIRSGPGTGIGDDMRRFAQFARNNPLIRL